MEDEYKKNLALAKEQYDTDVKFVRGRHSDSIVKLQSQHEDTMGEVNREYEKEIDNLQKMLAEERKQCKEKLQSLEDKLDKCNKELENERIRRTDQQKSDDGEGEGQLIKSSSPESDKTGDTTTGKTCPCGVVIQKSKDGKTEPMSLKHATALIAKVNYNDGTKPAKISLAKRTIVMTNIEPDRNNLSEENQFMTVEEERPVSLSQSVESILSKALKAGIEVIVYK